MRKRRRNPADIYKESPFDKITREDYKEAAKYFFLWLGGHVLVYVLIVLLIKILR